MISKKSVKLTILVSEIIYMVIELCASYLFSPYFGSSDKVWTGIIGVVLLSGSIGNYIGGKLVLKKEKDYIPCLFLLTSVFIFLIGLFNDIVCVTASKLIINNTLAALSSSFILLLPVSICLGTMPPQLMAREAKENEKEIGKVYMTSTIGGLFGTFMGGYLLIPYLGVNTILFLCGIITFVFGFSFKEKSGYKPAFFSILFGVFFGITVFSMEKQSLIYEDTLVFDSLYNRILVVDTKKDGEEIRQMIMDAGYHSATYLEKDKRYDFISDFKYLKAFEEIISIKELKEGSLLMLGGAAYQFPKYILAHYDNLKIDVVELDEEVTRIAKEYFFLQDCIDTYDKKGIRMGLFNEDAKVYIKNCNKKYDVIYNDVFAGKVPVRTLTTVESVKEIDALLEKNGVYVINVLGYTPVNENAFIKAEMKTLSEVFEHVSITECNGTEDGYTNFRITASHIPLPIKALSCDYEDSFVLTDNYCPIESLLP